MIVKWSQNGAQHTLLSEPSNFQETRHSRYRIKTLLQYANSFLRQKLLHLIAFTWWICLKTPKISGKNISTLNDNLITVSIVHKWRRTDVRDCCFQILLPWMVNHEKTNANQNRKHTWRLHSANKRQSAEIRVATAPAQNALLASVRIWVPRLPHYIHHSLNKAHTVINSLSSFTDISCFFLFTEKGTFGSDFIKNKIKPNSGFTVATNGNFS